jgi:phenylacetate-CoA ligase
MTPSLAKTTIDTLVCRRMSLVEPLQRRELEQAQLTALHQLVKHARKNSPFYRKHLAGYEKEELRSLSDLAAWPLLEGPVLVRHGQGLLAVSQAEVARMVTLHTSGSTGAPKRLAYGHDDLQATAEFFLTGMGNLVGQKDRVLVLLPCGLADSVGQLLISALQDGGIAAFAHWPPELTENGQMMEVINEWRPTCLVGLPQHLLAVAEMVGKAGITTMLLCSDYAAPALRRRIEQRCGCTTFLHYGSTESGLGGGVECGNHDGCHLRESDLLVEIVDPKSGQSLPDRELGEVVITTLQRRTMPLIRYRTGDLARLDRSPCGCGGATARLTDIRGRLGGCLLHGGEVVHSQDLDDLLFATPGLIDYRLLLDHDGIDRLHGEFVFTVAGPAASPAHLRHVLEQHPAIAKALAAGALGINTLSRVNGFSPTHTVKRTIIDLRPQGEHYAPCF